MNLWAINLHTDNKPRRKKSVTGRAMCSTGSDVVFSMQRGPVEKKKVMIGKMKHESGRS
jgi:hypothetical protein